MKMIKEEKFNREIKEDFKYNFEIEQDGLYLIEIIAGAKSWWQNTKKFRSFFRDDDLTVKINNREFPKLNGKRGLFDSEVAWNGNSLKGLLKTGVFIVYLRQGKCCIQFLVNQKPYLKSVAISRVESPGAVTYIPTSNNPAEDGNRRQWTAFVFIDLPIRRLNIKARAEKRKKDDDDLKLIIDGKIQKRKIGTHKNWYWCGWNDNGAEREFSRKLSLKPDIHYIELWADRQPFLRKAVFELSDNQDKQDRKDNKEEQASSPTVDNPEYTGNYRDDTEQMILARTIFAEARSLTEQGRMAVGWSIRNRVEDRRWGNNYHDVILEPAQYSALNKTDINLPFFNDPFIDETQVNVWYECYNIAGRIIRDEVLDPTDGANHYYSDYIKAPYWVKSKNAELKIKIGNTYFYNLIIHGRGGFIKTLFIIFMSTAFLLLGGLYLAVVINNKCSDSKEVWAGTWDEPAYKHFYINPKTEEVEVIYFGEDGNFLRTRQVTDDGYPKSHLNRFSPARRVQANFEMFGYFKDLHKRNEYYDLDDEAVRKEYYENYVTLMIMKDEYSEPLEVYQGDYHTSSWEWSATDNKHVKVFYNCGSSCMYVYEINIDTGKIESEGHVY